VKISQVKKIVLGAGFAVLGIAVLLTASAASKPDIVLRVDQASPREVEEPTQRAVLRDYTTAWEAMNVALANNTLSPLNDNFAGFALEALTQRVKDQEASSLKTRIIDHGHKVDAIFYSRDGSAIQLRDTATLETQILDGNTILHSDESQVQYIAIMTGAEARWKVRVLQDVEGR